MQRSETEGVVTLTLDHGKANALDVELCEWLIESLSSARDARAVILTGRGSIFCAGVDLQKVISGGAGYVQDFFPVLSRALETVFTFPRPLIVAVNGHAIAGGCLLAAAADYRVMSGGTIGIPELRVGVPFPAMAVEILRFAAGARAQRLALLGEVVDAQAAQQVGLIDQVVAPEELIPRANEVAATLAAMAPEAFRLTKAILREPHVRNAAAASSIDEEGLRVWSDPRTHEIIRAYLERVLRK